ncbi:hypothetical protein [Actinoplanes philippinensis]
MTAAAKVVAFQQWGNTTPKMERADPIANVGAQFKSISAIPAFR